MSETLSKFDVAKYNALILHPTNTFIICRITINFKLAGRPALANFHGGRQLSTDVKFDLPLVFIFHTQNYSVRKSFYKLKRTRRKTSTIWNSKTMWLAHTRHQHLVLLSMKNPILLLRVSSRISTRLWVKTTYGGQVQLRGIF